MDLNSLPLKYQRQAYHQLANGKPKENDNSAALRGSIKKQGRALALPEAIPIQKFHSPCIVTVSVWKCGGNWDADNIETKCLIDSIVKSGICDDDTIKEVPEVRKKGYRCKTKAEEKTIITIEPIQ